MLAFLPMAAITIGLGFVRTPEHEAELRKAAAARPDKWTIVMVGGPPGFFDVRVDGGTDGEWHKTFTPDSVESAIRWLLSFKKNTP